MLEQAMALLEHGTFMIAGEALVAGSVPDDPKDEMLQACALDGQADFIVSDNHHILGLGLYRDIPMMTARQFLDQLRQD
jgi:hypothetical protein